MKSLNYIWFLNDMDKRRYNFWVYRCLCFLMALTVINISIDSRDTTSRTGRTTMYHEDLSINKIESISELILEEVFGIQNAVPEQDDSNDESELTEQDYEFNQLFAFAPLRPLVHYLNARPVPFWPERISIHVSEIVGPPPQPILPG
ncbi:hypothetical protein [Spirosoma sp. KNUC1025]|uniref:hypothetical protein n=1 Tax=Spirosoma sp. KNUC1025 TaxID=2894082 RepID=UPI003867C292|nr:hypothetical protein LN737_18570 [Spirosoma sp. KNUC1025]